MDIQHENRYAFELLKIEADKFRSIIKTMFGPKRGPFGYEESFCQLEAILLQIHNHLLNNFDNLSKSDKSKVSTLAGSLLDEWNDHPLLERNCQGTSDFLKGFSNYVTAKGGEATKKKAEKHYKITEGILKKIESEGRKLPIARAMIENAISPHWPSRSKPPKQKTLFDYQSRYLRSKG